MIALRLPLRRRGQTSDVSHRKAVLAVTSAIQADLNGGILEVLTTSAHSTVVPQPLALIEAQGLGVPAVATRCPYGPDEIVVDQKTGVLVPTGDRQAIASAMGFVLCDAARRQRMSQQAAHHVRQQFDARRLVRKWEVLCGGRTTQGRYRAAA